MVRDPSKLVTRMILFRPSYLKLPVNVCALEMHHLLHVREVERTHTIGIGIKSPKTSNKESLKILNKSKIRKQKLKKTSALVPLFSGAMQERFP